MKKEKIAGIDRPYTSIELGKIIERYIEEENWASKACLDYYSAWDLNETEIVSEAFDSFSITTFGSNEGIYTDFYIEYQGREKICLLTAKTLGTTKEYYVKMHEMAANVGYRFDEFVRKNLDNFLWSGYSVSFVDKDGAEHNSVICGNMERVAYNANELRKEYGAVKVFYVDNYTRKKKEYKF